MKQAIITLVTIVFLSGAKGQTVFFKSNNIPGKESSTFYSSIRIQGDLLLYNADDYKLYVYDKQTMQLKWSKYIGWKSNRAPYVVGKEIWCRSGENEMLRLSVNDGSELKPLRVSSVLSEPFVKGDMAYFTGIYEAGCIVGYDLAADSVKWSRFIAHGCDVKPFYLDNKMIVNAEGDNWIEMDYNGMLLNRKCEEEEYRFPGELSCVRKFRFLTHDNKEVNSALAEELMEDGYKYSFYKADNYSCLLAGEELTVFGNKLKVTNKINISSLNDTLDVADYSYMQVLGATGNIVSFFHSGHFFQYDVKKKILLKDVDLSHYIVYQAILQEDKLLIVSEEDRLLYGLDISSFKTGL